MIPFYMITGELVIDTPQKLKSKLQMVEALGEIEVATKLLEDDTVMQGDPLYSHYQRLHCELTTIEADSMVYKMIEKYMKNTHAKTHSIYTVDIFQIFRASREGEAERFKKAHKLDRNFISSLRIAPPEAPVTGYMFGKGVYFADMFSKSANYAIRLPLQLLVALGDMAELLYTDYNADNLPEGKLSTKGIGTTAPDISETQMLDDGVIVPLGSPKQQLGPRLVFCTTST
ncbi:hypothetical protein ACH5RR_020018 [Cinchona calisaya]|uniref:Poly [ADP-ribose] polymerase n=1 Tax=Cinchona calisaya TaxID=153742 RepID=A0ABD2ZEB0_9GENT